MYFCLGPNQHNVSIGIGGVQMCVNLGMSRQVPASDAVIQESAILLNYLYSKFFIFKKKTLNKPLITTITNNNNDITNH